jgi:hypothetical protein
MGTTAASGRGARPGRCCGCVFAAALLLLGPIPARAAHPLVTDDAGTLGRGNRQLELNAEWAQEHVDATDGATTSLHEHARELVAALALGVHDRADVVLSVPLAWSEVREHGAGRERNGGVGDVGLELKWRAFERGSFSFAVKPGLTFPTGNEARGLGAGAIGYGAAVIASQALGPVALHLNAAWTRQNFGTAEDRAAHRDHVFHGSVALVGSPLERLQLLANVGLETNAEHGEEVAPAFALAGAIWSVTGALDLDVGVKVGLSDPEADLALLAGLASRF